MTSIVGKKVRYVWDREVGPYHFRLVWSNAPDPSSRPEYWLEQRMTDSLGESIWVRVPAPSSPRQEAAWLFLCEALDELAHD